MPLISVLTKSAAGTRTKMMRDVASKPVARLCVETLVGPSAIVTHRCFEGRLDVDEREVIENVPDEHPTKLAKRDAPVAKLVLGPQSRAVHVEQRAVEVEKGGGSWVQVASHEMRSTV